MILSEILVEERQNFGVGGVLFMSGVNFKKRLDYVGILRGVRTCFLDY